MNYYEVLKWSSSVISSRILACLFTAYFVYILRYLGSVEIIVIITTFVSLCML